MELTDEKLDDVVQFAQALYNVGSLYGYGTNGAFMPSTQNQNLKDLTIAPNITISYDKICEALEQSLQSDTNLQAFSEFMNVYDTIYQKTLSYYENLLAFDLSWTCNNATKPKDWTSKQFEKDEIAICNFFDKFKYKREFVNKVMPFVIRTGVFYGWFRDSMFTTTPKGRIKERKVSRYTIQILPQRYCKITDYSDMGCLFDFDMNYFLKGTVDPMNYAPFFTRKMKELSQGNSYNYSPHKGGINRDGSFAMWTQTSQEEGAFCIKFDESNFNALPPFANLMKVLYQNTRIQDIQMDKNIASAWAVLFGSIGTMQNEKSGQKPNQWKIDPKAIGKFLQLVQGSLQSIMKVAALPLEQTHFGQFQDTNKGLVGDSLLTSSNQGAFGSALIYNPNATSFAVVQNALLMDYNRIKKVYAQFSSYLELWANRETSKYKFDFVLNGSNLGFERQDRRTAINELATKGLVLNPSSWASVYGIEPQTFIRSLQQTHSQGIDNLMSQMINLNIMSGKDSPNNGRPQADDNNLGDSGSQSRDYKEG